MNTQRTLAERIDSVLINKWNPIGGRDIFEAQDKYRMYVAGVESNLVVEGIADKANTLNIERKAIDLK